MKMTIDNVRFNGKPLGAFLDGEHGAINTLDASGKQRGLTSPYYFQGARDAAHPTIDFALAYIGRNGNVTPIKKFEFEVVDEEGETSQHVTMEDCVVTAWSLSSPWQPDQAGSQPTAPDREFVRIESINVHFQAGGESESYERTDPNQSK